MAIHDDKILSARVNIKKQLVYQSSRINLAQAISSRQLQSRASICVIYLVMSLYLRLY